MRLLLWSDLHCDVAAARRLVARAEDADVVVGAGDFATCRRGLASTLEVLRAIDRPAVVVPGNSESADELVAEAENATARRALAELWRGRRRRSPEIVPRRRTASRR